MTKAEAAKKLTRLKNEFLEEYIDFDGTTSAYDMAIEALKKQEPEFVIDVSDGYADGCDVFDEAECPACGFYFESCDNIWGEPYCPHCGQALNWEIEQ